MNGNVAGTGQLHGLALGFVGNFVGEDDHRVRIADFVHEIPFIAADAFKAVPFFLCSRDVILLQSVHAADQGNAHCFLLHFWPSRTPTAGNTVMFKVCALF